MVLNLGVAAFWLAIGAWLVAGSLSPWLRQKEVQKTIRALIDKEGRIDADTLALIRGPERRASDGGWSNLTGRQFFAMAIFGAGLMLGFSSLVVFMSPRPGWTVGVVEYLWGAAGFVVAVGVFGVVAYRVGRTPRPPG